MRYGRCLKIKFINRNKWYFKDKETEEKLYEAVYFALAVVFLLTLIDFVKYLPIANELYSDIIKLGILIILIAIYGWSNAKIKTDKKENK